MFNELFMPPLSPGSLAVRLSNIKFDGCKKMYKLLLHINILMCHTIRAVRARLHILRLLAMAACST